MKSMRLSTTFIQFLKASGRLVENCTKLFSHSNLVFCIDVTRMALYIEYATKNPINCMEKRSLV